ncbi:MULTISPECIES: acyl-CoA dehydrogenase [Tenacibaculum]|uniref:Cyclohex-1-ene-1-carbonyl-CoA dehydrogenase n=1 Tax=Tenacibaculum singaporense TaxID=2358479 RepID=A0A3S8R5G6_9FLAO|nr:MULTISPECIES: acyl-CoA dehydrogenase [Tenacibaculum]GFD73498.1 acyl-CoA dehydrogenase [Tenacibaculum sp. KUL113]GFD83392.1 acyl-CoA dehydrogenase [Tenacibaculum sp. KUL118]AZJ35015.1 acyl-CoA dehydrogenase [Tenacibaculum singaporense]KAF9658606.1 acyl-CoA dehydrogenase [Tenacibaculum mesophilum]MCO7186323.1 acyl-CoA dehydrogenase [Tenacibaculum sp. XPcli2-G]|eukprot:TRINITY_DN5414_c0_g1_i1.p1 TRINITY_DN5414_c0_g1~~TRINITY_DN5414_c0_g1_i1.p1  ORF type:complete len:381 (+),score=102.21 TRINITY_DN5414_c0_g1_i1:280-1422(+)
MDFNLTEEHLMIRDAARDFAQTELLPGVIERDEKQEFPNELVRKMGELGFMGVMVDPKYGGSGMDAVSYVLIMEELSKIDASASVMVSVNNSLVCYGLEAYGTEEQKQKYLTKLATGEQIGAFCLSEPEAGSDATSQATTAEDKGDYYLLNGTKNWITNGGRADTYLVIAQTDRAKGHRGINAFIIEKGMEGFHIGPKEDKLGIRGSDTHTLQFNDVKVPKENRIGEDGFGFKFAMKTLSGGRIGIAAQALGIASGAYELALKYSKERKAFGTEICNHQAIAFKLADMYTEIAAARHLVMAAACKKDAGENYDREGAMAKLYASKVAMEQTVEAVQIHGGNGFVKEYHVERLMRDAKITQIYEGTSEIQKIVISRSLIRD